MAETARTVIVFAVAAGFMWLIYAALRNAWNAEQEHKTREAAWIAAHPAAAPTPRERRGEMIAGTIYLIIGGSGAYLAGLNAVQTAAILALPVLLYRGWRQYRRRQDAASAQQFGPYVPTFRDRR